MRNTEGIDVEARKYLFLAGLSEHAVSCLNALGYFMMPASAGHHLAVPGGLAEHSVNVTRRLVQLTDTLGVRWSRRESPYLVGMLHDLVKCRCYEVAAANGEETTYRKVQPVMPGHGMCSVLTAAECGIHLMPDETAAIVYHMGAFGVGKEYKIEELSAALGSYAPQVVATCSADWFAAKVDEEPDHFRGLTKTMECPGGGLAEGKGGQ